MKIRLSDEAIEVLKDAPPDVRHAFEKQLHFLAADLKHPSLRAKKYDESQDLWQARVNRSWRFYFNIADDIYVIRDLIPHPNRLLHVVPTRTLRIESEARSSHTW